MPIIRIDFDDTILSDADAKNLSNAIQKIVSEKTDIKDVFVYANSSQIKVAIAPIEIFIEMSAKIMMEKENLSALIKQDLSQWKKDTSYPHLINMTLIPMEWTMEIGI